MTGAFTPAAAAQMVADNNAVLARVDLGMLKVLTRHPEPCPDCDGSGVEGDEVHQGEFQPPERYPCSSCGGSRVATPYVPPIPTGTATESGYGDLMDAVKNDPLRSHFEDRFPERDKAEEDMQRERDRAADEELFKTWPEGDS